MKVPLQKPEHLVHQRSQLVNGGLAGDNVKGDYRDSPYFRQVLQRLLPDDLKTKGTVRREPHWSCGLCKRYRSPGRFQQVSLQVGAQIPLQRLDQRSPRYGKRPVLVNLEYGERLCNLDQNSHRGTVSPLSRRTWGPRKPRIHRPKNRKNRKNRKKKSFDVWSLTQDSIRRLVPGVARRL